MSIKTYIVLKLESAWKQLDIDQSGQFIPIRTIDPNSTYITIQCNEFIRFFKNKGISQLPVVIDMECFAKQMLQEGTDLDNNPKWSVLRFLRTYSQIDSDFKLKPSTS